MMINELLDKPLKLVKESIFEANQSKRLCDALNKFSSLHYIKGLGMVFRKGYEEPVACEYVRVIKDNKVFILREDKFVIGNMLDFEIIDKVPYFSTYSYDKDSVVMFNNLDELEDFVDNLVEQIKELENKEGDVYGNRNYNEKKKGKLKW